MAGYEGILGKVRLLLTASIQDVLNRALNANKPAVFDEEINKLQGSLETITISLGETIGRETTLTREIGEYKAQLDKIDGEIDRLLDLEEKEADPGRLASIRALATDRQSKYNTTNEICELKESQLAAIKAQRADLEDARIKLSARIDLLRSKKAQLMALIAERKAAEAQGQALSVADIQSRFSPEALIREEQEAVERARGIVTARTSTVDQQLDDILGSDELQRQLDERRARRRSAGS